MVPSFHSIHRRVILGAFACLLRHSVCCDIHIYNNMPTERRLGYLIEWIIIARHSSRIRQRSRSTENNPKEHNEQRSTEDKTYLRQKATVATGRQE